MLVTASQGRTINPRTTSRRLICASASAASDPPTARLGHFGEPRLNLALKFHWPIGLDIHFSAIRGQSRAGILLYLTAIASLLDIPLDRKKSENKTHRKHKMPSIKVDPFTVDIPEAEVARLKRKLVDTRLPEQEIVPGAGDAYGTSTCTLQNI